MPAESIQYSERYYDDIYEYRHVILSQDYARNVPKCHLMTETEWRNLGICQSTGWVRKEINTFFKFKKVSFLSILGPLYDSYT